MSDCLMQFALPFQEFAVETSPHACLAAGPMPDANDNANTRFGAPLPDRNNIDMTELAPPLMEIPAAAQSDHVAARHEPRFWMDNGWTARIIKNEDDEGWAVEMCREGESEPVWIAPWTMGRDKKNPKPLDTTAFTTLVKAASEVLRRHEQQLHAMLHKSMTVNTISATIHIALDIVPDEDDPYAMLSARDDDDNLIAQRRVSPAYKLTMASATAWIEDGFSMTSALAGQGKK